MKDAMWTKNNFEVPKSDIPETLVGKDRSLSDNLSLILAIHMVEGEGRLLKLVT